MQVNPLPKPGKRKPKASRDINPQKQQRIVDPQAVKDARREYCVNCGLSMSKTKYEVHHIDRRSQGGDDLPENLINLCTGPGSNCCHERAGGQTVIIKKEKCGPIDKKRLREMWEMEYGREGGE